MFFEVSFALASALVSVAAPVPRNVSPLATLSNGSGVGETATRGLLVQLALQDGSDPSTLSSALTAAVPEIDNEPGTLSWFGAQVNNGTASSAFVVFDTFANDADRATHLGGSVASSLIAQAPSFAGGLSIDPYDILAIKATDDGGANVTLGLRILFTAQDSKIADVQKFCRDSLALVEAEPGTLNWQCIQLPGTTTFGILDSFPDNAARDAHLGGQVAKNLFAIVPTLLTGAPDIQLIDIVAATVKSSSTGVLPAGSIPVTSTATIGLLVPFTAQPNDADAVKSFVQGATGLAAAEPGTLQWFGAALQNNTSSDLLVYDTFASNEDREAHLAGKVAGGLLSQIGALSSLDIIPYDIFAIKSTNDAVAVASPTSGVTVGLRIFFNATSTDNIPRVQDFCRKSLALINAEAGTLNWLCGQIPDTQTFLILDSFDTEDSRNIHLQGKFAQSLFGIAGSLIDTPDVQLTEIFAGTSKSDEEVNAATTTTDSLPEATVTTLATTTPCTTSTASHVMSSSV